ncbi:MAG: Hsp20/alpha crystallin family protein [Acidianus infernus]|nr:Hsp20/alpha crystallin family protein [Acidianus infernus]
MPSRERDIFDLADELIREIGEEFERIEREFERSFREIKERLESVPRIRKPLVDVVEKENEIKVIAELPGVNKEDIKVRVNGNKLIISAKSEDRQYYTEVELPAEVDEKSAKAVYRNGVLEVTLQKKEGKEIKVE